MNEKFRKLFISAMAILTGFLLLFPVGMWSVSADSSIQDDITYIINQPYRFSSIKYGSSSANARFVRFRLGTNNTNSFVTPDSAIDPVTLYGITYVTSDNYKYILIFSDTKFNLSGSDAITCRWDSSFDNLNWTYGGLINSTNEYTAQVNNNGVTTEGTKIYYVKYQISGTISDPSSNIFTNAYMMPNIPRIQLQAGQDEKSILYLFSADDFSYVPWNFSTSSGGMHFSDGTNLNPENTSTYSRVYIVMDLNHDNSVTEEEVNYYNYTYNTNYDYSEINEGNNFTELEFLNWIALQLANGNDNPAGEGNGLGGGSSAIGGGITVGDGSFTQTQTQTIEENAVNVTVNNNNELSQENMQYLNNVINNNLGTEGNAFGDAISAISGFSAVARSFAGLVSIMFGFLPSWVLTIMGLMFTILFVFIVFRLIHLFI